MSSSILDILGYPACPKMPLHRSPTDPVSYMPAHVGISGLLGYLKWFYMCMFRHFNCLSAFKHLSSVICHLVLKDTMRDSTLSSYGCSSSEPLQSSVSGWHEPMPRNAGFLLYFNMRDDLLFWQIEYFISQFIIVWMNVELLIVIYISFRKS